MNEEEVRALSADGVEIGAHTVTHPDLTTLRYEEARSELEASKRDLEALLEVPIDVAAYPFGRATAETARACRDAGFRAACRVSGEGSWSDPYNLPRQDMHNGSTLLGLRLKRDDRYQSVMRFLPARAARALVRRGRLTLGL